ncbi:MAG: hypothetical protein AABZ39_00820 [Spirochaetota bacterium]
MKNPGRSIVIVSALCFVSSALLMAGLFGDNFKDDFSNRPKESAAIYIMTLTALGSKIEVDGKEVATYKLQYGAIYLKAGAHKYTIKTKQADKTLEFTKEITVNASEDAFVVVRPRLFSADAFELVTEKGIFEEFYGNRKEYNLGEIKCAGEIDLTKEAKKK